MNIRDRFLELLNFRPCGRTPRWEMGYWSGAVQRWYEEGLPGSQQKQRASEAFGEWVNGGAQPAGGHKIKDRDRDVSAYFNFDKGAVAVAVNTTVAPAFVEESLEETDSHIIMRRPDGVISRELKEHYKEGMPEWIDFPVHNRQEWEKFKAERYQPKLGERVPSNWDELVQEYRQRDYPLCLGSGLAGFFGTVRQIVGLERLLTLFYDDPAWVHEMIDHLADFYVKLYDQVLSVVEVDYALHWEDMCFKNGPLISPKMFSEFMIEPYKKLTGCLRDHGVEIVFVDNDGDTNSLIPLFIEGGVTALYPLEVNCGMDVAEVRRKYPKLRMQGGIDKQALAAGKDAIDKELEKRVPVVLHGGYIPHVDHGVPPDVSWENFCYYRHKLDSMLDEYDKKRWETTR